MAEKEPKGILDLLANYKYLANPFFSLSRAGAPGLAPEGRWRLAARDGLNLALWNSLGVASWAVPTAALATYFANKWWDKKMRDKTDKSVVSRLSAIRPALTPDADITNIDNITKDPKRELELVDALISKKADEPADVASARADDVASPLAGWLKDVAAGTLPLFAIPTSVLATQYVVNKIYENRLRKRLEQERVAIRNQQNAVDHELMKVQGLIKGASKSSEKDYRKMVLEEARKNNKKDTSRSLTGTILSAPIVGGLLGTGLLSFIAYKYLADKDKDSKTLEYTAEKSLGRNVMQDTPEIGLEQFGIPVTDIVSRPGDKKKPGYISKSDNEEKSNNIDLNKKVNLLEDLEEVEPIVAGDASQKPKKSDALF